MKNPALMLIVATLVVAVVAIVVMVALQGCDDGCRAEEKRCDGQRLEICNAGGDWELVSTCDQIVGGGPWACCWAYDPWVEGEDWGCYREADCIEDEQ